jgi:hypothetical protein
VHYPAGFAHEQKCRSIIPRLEAIRDAGKARNY